jgi:anion-transporting  ArsA/GET3 family ATPase
VNHSMDDIIQRRKIIITCGTGGVGKTTLSAAIAIRAAMLGKKVVVVTIDPAKRLAHSLGLLSLSDQPTDLTAQAHEAYQRARTAGLSVPEEFKGRISAIVPDTRGTFENFVNELAPNPEAAQRVMQNPIFQIFAREFSGTNEYMALERLLALHQQEAYDCIVIDTPPSRNTLAFLNAPQLLAQFFDERLIRWLLLPTNKIMSLGMRKALGILERLTGAGFMTHLLDFASALFSVQANFSKNLKKIGFLLQSPQVGFLMVTTPSPETAPEANHFIQTLRERGFNFEGIILNRTLNYFEMAKPKPGFEKPFHLIEALQNREQRIINSLLRNPIPVCAKLPELSRDIHSLEDLFHVALAFNQPITH